MRVSRSDLAGLSIALQHGGGHAYRFKVTWPGHEGEAVFVGAQHRDSRGRYHSDVRPHVMGTDGWDFDENRAMCDQPFVYTLPQQFPDAPVEYIVDGTICGPANPRAEQIIALNIDRFGGSWVTDAYANHTVAWVVTDAGHACAYHSETENYGGAVDALPLVPGSGWVTIRIDPCADDPGNCGGQ